MKGFLDDDPLKQNARIMGIPVLGSGREAFSVVRPLEPAQAHCRGDHHCDALGYRAADARDAGQLPRRRHPLQDRSRHR